MRTWVWIVYFGGDTKKQKGRRGEEMGKGKRKQWRPLLRPLP